MIKRCSLAGLAAVGLVGCGGSSPSQPTFTSAEAGAPPQFAGTLVRAWPGTGTPAGAWRISCTGWAGFPNVVCPKRGFIRATTVTSGYIEWVRLPKDTSARWVGIATDGSVGGGVGDDQRRVRYVFQTTIDLGPRPSKDALIGVEWAADNYFDGWRINGSPLQGGSPDNRRFLDLHQFTISASNATLKPGRNLLELQVTGDGVTDGLVVRTLELRKNP